jgi:hypothetical protein
MVIYTFSSLAARCWCMATIDAGEDCGGAATARPFLKMCPSCVDALDCWWMLGNILSFRCVDCLALLLDLFLQPLRRLWRCEDVKVGLVATPNVEEQTRKTRA